MGNAVRWPGGTSSPAGTIALFYQWYNYEEIRRALAPSYFTDKGISSSYVWRFTPTKDCTIQFNILKSYSSGWWLTFSGGDYSSTAITNGMTLELKKGVQYAIGYSHRDHVSNSLNTMITANFVK